jgi:tetratricopeptide (TPR) repeat protein
MLDSLIQQVDRRVRADDPAAVSDAARLAERYSDDARVWCLLAYANARQGKNTEAVASITKAIDLSPGEPGMHFDRGRYNLKLGKFQQAVDDFDRALVVCEERNDDYYRESLHFLRADALIKLDRKAEARADLMHVRDEFALWTNELRTKTALMAESADSKRG